MLGISEDPAALGYVLAAHTVPTIVFLLWGGVVADRLPRTLVLQQLQQVNALVSLARSALVVLGPSTGALLVVSVGAEWALAVDAATWLVAAVLLGNVRIPPRAPRPAGEAAPGTLAELREGWTFVRSTTWLWVVVLGFSLLNVVHAGAWSTLGPARAEDTFGAQGWGLVLSAEGVGLLLMTLVCSGSVWNGRC